MSKQALKKTVIFRVVALILSFGLVLESVASDESERFSKIKVFAEQGYALEQAFLGSYYEDGIGVRQDYGKAVEWYRKSADQGNVEGQYQLGRMYYSGYAVRQDYKKSLYWFRKAADQNGSYAQYRLGLMSQYGVGIKQNKVVAKEWYGKSCDNGLQIGCDSYRDLNEQNY